MVLSLDRILDKVKIDDNRVKLLISFLLAREGDFSKRSSRVLKNQPSPPSQGHFIRNQIELNLEIKLFSGEKLQ